MTTLTYPFDEKSIRALKAGDAVSITGRIYTGRDKFHKFFADGGKLPVDFRDGALYHCGPVVVQDPHSSSLIPHPSVLIPNPSFLIPHPSSLLPRSRRRTDDERAGESL